MDIICSNNELESKIVSHVPLSGTGSRGFRTYMSNPFCFLQHIRSKWGNIYIKVIENKQDNSGDHDKGRKTEEISPPDFVHKLAHKGLI